MIDRNIPDSRRRSPACGWQSYAPHSFPSVARFVNRVSSLSGYSFRDDGIEADELLRIPNLDRTISSGGGQALALGRNREREYLA